MVRQSFTALILIFTLPVNAATLKKVRIDFVEALAPRDTTSSERFQKDYEGGIDLAKTLLSKKLSKCGYEFETKTAFYEASDNLKAKELAEKAVTEGTWLVVGPRRSNHYLLLVQGSPSTPTVSLMAGADDVFKLGPNHVSLSPANSQLADAAAREAKARTGRSASYITVVSDDCTYCVDFSASFDQAASKIGLNKIDEIKVRGESFDTAPIAQIIKIKKPKFVLLPNYSKVASAVMNAFSDLKKPPLFVGGDGWGDNRYGFVQNGQKIENVEGFTVRGFPTVEKGLEQFPAGKEALRKNVSLPFSASAVGIIKIFDSVTKILCSDRPKAKEDFKKIFPKVTPSLHAPWGVSIYTLKSGEIRFHRTQPVRR